MGDKKFTIPPETMRYLTVGIEFIGVFGFFLALGYLADQHWSTTPAFTIVGMVVGFIAAMYRLLRLARQHDKRYIRWPGRKDS